MNTLVVCPQCEKLNRVALEKAAKSLPICGNCKVELQLHDGVQEISTSSLNKLIRLSDRPIVVDFWANWCGPCKVFAPTFIEASKRMGGQMVFAKMDTEKYPSVNQAFQIRGIPTLIVFNKGVEISRQSGAIGLPQLLNYLSQWK